MAKTAKPETTDTTEPTQASEPSVNNAAESQVPEPLVNAPDLATPENTPIPGGGSWRWDYQQGCWVAPAETAANPFTTPE